MKLRSAQRGVTILQVLLFTVMSVMVAVPLLNAALGRMNQGAFNDALASARAISHVMESSQRRATFTGIDPATGVYQYNFPGRSATFITVATLNAQMGTALPEQTPYLTNYEARGNGTLSEVRFTVPDAVIAEVQVPRTVTVTSAGGVSTVLLTTTRIPRSFAKRRLAWAKHQHYQESSR